jgi:transposase
LGAAVLFVGDDWAEAHHDIEIGDASGRVLVRRRLPEGLAGITALHELVAEHLDPTAEPDQVQVGIETDRGLWVQALLAAGYVVFAINPLQVARYRERHSPSGGEVGYRGCPPAGRDRPAGSGASPQDRRRQ